MGGLLGTLYALDIRAEGSTALGVRSPCKTSGAGPDPNEQPDMSTRVTDADDSTGGSGPEGNASPSGSSAEEADGLGFDVDTRTRTQWKKLMGICNRRNYTSCRDIEKTSWTDASKSVISELRFAGLGAWSTFGIATYTAQGTAKSRGGDSWFVTLRDEEQRLK